MTGADASPSGVGTHGPPMHAAPRRRPGRFPLIGALVVLCVGGVAGALWLIFDDTAADDSGAWFAPYVDVTLEAPFRFEDQSGNPADQVVLGFVVAASDGSCTPTWGTFFTLERAATSLDLDRRIDTLRQRGGDIVVSFGGALNDELALRCGSVDELASAYSKVIERYQLQIIDFDIEGSTVADREANERRAQAIVILQQNARDAGTALEVWATLPATPLGVAEDSIALLDTMVGAGVELTGMNVMTMNYGSTRPDAMTMWVASEEALVSSWGQLRDVYQRAGQPRGEAELWRMIGATPLVGQNDVAADVFTLSDAQELLDFAATRQIGRISMWSANRDGPCEPELDVSVYQNSCSGVEQQPLEFSELLAGLQ